MCSAVRHLGAGFTIGFQMLKQVMDVLRLLPHGGPGVCNIAVTNVCNATCDFCGYARNKQLVSEERWLHYDRTCRAIDILHDRGIRYLCFSGGEPLLHSRIYDLIAYAVRKGMRPSVVTNGSLLDAASVRDLGQAGLRSLFISIDAPRAEIHERNRGLPGVCQRIKSANLRLAGSGIRTVASVAISKLIHDLDALFLFIAGLGFSAVTFSYPKRDLGSSSMVYSRTSKLMNFETEELIDAFEAIVLRKEQFAVLNPIQSLLEMIRFLHRKEQIFPCVGGYRYFYLDYRYDIYRCDFWPTRMCAIEEFRDASFVRDGCTQCMSGCYRDASVYMHAAVSVGDALRDLAGARPVSATRRLFTKSNYRSLKSLYQERHILSKLARTSNNTL